MENKSEQGLKHTQRALMCVYAGLMLFALIWVILGEFSQANFIGIWQGETGLLFVCQIIFQLGTLALIPLALRLFKFSKIHHSLVNFIELFNMLFRNINKKPQYQFSFLLLFCKYTI